MRVFELLGLLLAVWEKQSGDADSRRGPAKKVVLESGQSRKPQELSYTIELYKVIYSS